MDSLTSKWKGIREMVNVGGATSGVHVVKGSSNPASIFVTKGNRGGSLERGVRGAVCSFQQGHIVGFLETSPRAISRITSCLIERLKCARMDPSSRACRARCSGLQMTFLLRCYPRLLKSLARPREPRR